jgi:hypothetical protein
VALSRKRFVVDTPISLAALRRKIAQELTGDRNSSFNAFELLWYKTNGEIIFLFDDEEDEFQFQHILSFEYNNHQRKGFVVKADNGTEPFQSCIYLNYFSILDYAEYRVNVRFDHIEISDLIGLGTHEPPENSVYDYLLEKFPENPSYNCVLFDSNTLQTIVSFYDVNPYSDLEYSENHHLSNPESIF